MWVSAGWLRLGEWEQGADHQRQAPSVDRARWNLPCRPRAGPLGALRGSCLDRDGPVGRCVCCSSRSSPSSRPLRDRPYRESCGRGLMTLALDSDCGDSVGLSRGCPGLAGGGGLGVVPAGMFLHMASRPGSCFSSGSLWGEPCCVPGIPEAAGLTWMASQVVGTLQASVSPPVKWSQRSSLALL